MAASRPVARSSDDVRRLGILLPSSNTVMEPETMALLPQDGSITAHFARFRMVAVSTEDESLRQFALEGMVAAATLLADVNPDLILWGGTAASWLGFAHDTALCDAITARTGIPAVTSVQLINRLLLTAGARRIGLVTPYLAEVESAIIANYGGLGLHVSAAERSGLIVNTDFATIAPSAIADMVRWVARSEPDAVVILCTNLKGAPVAEALAQELGRPVIDSVRASILEALAILERSAI
jgi:maleate isomerase